MPAHTIFVCLVCKRKKLIPEELFDIDYLKSEILKDSINSVRDEGLFKEANIKSVYYKAILQNLFFASLNCPTEPLEKGDKRKRGFRSGKNFGQHRDANYLMRYKDQFKNPEKFLQLLNEVVPFLNGGLFECPDNKTDKIYIDGFSDNLVKPHQLIVPDYLFFGSDQEADLSGVVGIKTKAFKKARVRGLISILESYKFTIAENTPVEEDVALDPELLGKVFENLLASYNPETKTTARKQTGSFYTPREIVSYMVDESLIAYLKNDVENWNTEADELDKQLHDLLSYDNINPFAENDDLKKQITHSLDNCKIFDPACGSGAFPMGILQKMVHILQKVDPENRYWQELQLNKAMKETEGAFAITDKKEREQKLTEINDAFDEKVNDPDYARKLFLVKDCVYGVDIQPVAAQISKLRFFISLITDQKVDKDKPNFGIRSLPNLETKFVAANTLIGIDKPKYQMTLFENQEIRELEKELKDVRHRIFSAKSPATKRRLRGKDEEIREKMGKLLTEHGWANETAKQLASWDPYDQNASSPFFDPEWMFGIKDGFDVVIGNPPYLREKGNAYRFENVNNSFLGKKYHQGKMDFWFYFLHQAIELSKTGGVINFITSRYWINSTGAEKLIKRVKKNLQFINVVDIGKLRVFDNVAGHHMISTFVKSQTDTVFKYKKLKNDISEVFAETSTENIEVTTLQNDLVFTDNAEINFSYKNNFEIRNTIVLDDIFEATQGVVQNPDKVSGKAAGKYKLNSNEGVFVLTEDEYSAMKLNSTEQEYVKDFYDDCAIGQYGLNENLKKHLLYVTKNNCHNIDRLPNLKKHLEKYRCIMDDRRENRKGTLDWYHMHWPRKARYFEKEKIAVPSMFSEPRAVFLSDKSYFGMGTNIINPRTKAYSLKYLLVILNSSFAKHWFNTNGKKRGSGMDIGVSKLRQFPVKTESHQFCYIALANILITIRQFRRNKLFHSIKRVADALVLELYFPDHMKERKIDILKFAEKDLKDVIQNRDFDQLTDDQKEKVVSQLHDRWTHPGSEVRNRIKLFAVRSPEILKPILESG